MYSAVMIVIIAFGTIQNHLEKGFSVYDKFPRPDLKKLEAKFVVELN